LLIDARPKMCSFQKSISTSIHAVENSVFQPRNGSLLPFSEETNAWFQARRGNPGSKLPGWDRIRLLKAATSRRAPNVSSAPWLAVIFSCLLSPVYCFLSWMTLIRLL
jgi:hypothetical protein